MTTLKLNYFLKVPNIATLGIRASAYEFRGHEHSVHDTYPSRSSLFVAFKFSSGAQAFEKQNRQPLLMIRVIKLVS